MSGVSTQCPSSQKKSDSGGDFTALIAGNMAMAADVPAGVRWQKTNHDS
jgi:hypothetical protein